MEKIILVCGGNSVEHEISILTTKQVYRAINKEKYDIKVVYISKGNKFYLVDDIENVKEINCLKKKPITLIKEDNIQYFKYKRAKYYFDYLFLLVHGKGVEDGTLAAYLEFNNIPYISNNILSSAIGMNKSLSKDYVKTINVKTLDHILLDVNNYNYDELVTNLNDYPYIFKANSLGSSIGVIKVNNEYEIIDAINAISVYDEFIIIEKCLEDFKEYNVALFTLNEEYIISSIEEINYKKILTYDDKYSNNGLDNLERIISPKINKKLIDLIINNSKKIYSKLGCDLLVRIDYIFDNINNTLYFNEINMIPGSLAYYLYEDKEIMFDELIDLLIDKGKRNIYLKKKTVNLLGDNLLEKLVNNIKK